MKHNEAQEIDPDEIFLDSSNLPEFDRQQFEGRIERAISKRAIFALGLGISTLFFVYLVRLGNLQIVRGADFRVRSEENSLRRVPLLSERGVIYDRTGTLLAWNDPERGRQYKQIDGLSHVIGYLGRPDFEEQAMLPIVDSLLRVGKAGIEKQYDSELQGVIGVKVEEVNANAIVSSENVEIEPRDGTPVTLAVDARLSERLYEIIARVALDRGFTGGAGVLMDVNTGEILAMTSYPEFPLSVVSGTTTPSSINDYLVDKRKPFLNRAVGGLYTPGSIVKPFIAVGALEEKVITPDKQIVSTGSIQIPNPFVPGTFTIFKDWKAHGAVDMRHAIAVSSDVYFYEIGGGYEDQIGLGINRIDKYIELFGLGLGTEIDIPGEQQGNVPSPAWKQQIFGEDWRLGDTYHTVIGQYGFQVTPIEIVRAVAALANGGKLLTPHLLRGGVVNKPIVLTLSPANLQVVREGMRLGAQIGTASSLNVSYVNFAGKTGTAELGDTKQRVNSWVEGFFPYEHPNYAFVIVMEKGHVGNTIGATAVARQFFDWMSVNTPEYFK